MATQSKARRERERHETRERILAAAREMFAADGYEAVTMRAIANRIEYTPTALYHHFPSKQALVTELCVQDFTALSARFMPLAQMPDPVERLQALGRVYLQFAMDYPSHYRFMFMTVLNEIEHTPEFLAESVMNPERNSYLLLRGACAEAIATGRVRPEFDDADAFAQTLWATLHGLISLRIVKQHDEWVTWGDLRASAEQAMQALLKGFLRSS